MANRKKLVVLARESLSDLVLLKAPNKLDKGVSLSEVTPQRSVGEFLLTPDPDGAGFVSVVGSTPFRSRKQVSRGFLGVVPTTFRDGQGALLTQVNDEGAADRAGLLVGDVVTKLNETLIRTQRDMRSFLVRVDPNSLITATVQREEEELTKPIRLDAFPTSTRHAADQMEKSGRRDGFQSIFPHDAVLSPQQCGGPVFDLNGRFVGLNIARYSRVRSFALPAKEVQQFIRGVSQQ